MSGILLFIIVINFVYVSVFVVYSIILTLLRLFGLNDPKINRDDREDLGRINESNVHFPEIEDSQIFKPPEKRAHLKAQILTLNTRTTNTRLLIYCAEQSK